MRKHVYQTPISTCWFVPCGFSRLSLSLSDDVAGSFSCSAWPAVSLGHYTTCTDNGNFWKVLDESMDISQTESCELLCQKQNEDGCCYLAIDLGCIWKGGDTAFSGKGVNVPGTAVGCTFTNWILVAENQECSGSEISKNLQPNAEIHDCAKECKGVSSMFIFRPRYNSCYCETIATAKGTCATVDLQESNLYKYVIDEKNEDDELKKDIVGLTTDVATLKTILERIEALLKTNSRGK